MSEAVSEKVREVLEWGAVESELLARCATDPGRARARSLAPLPIEPLRLQLRKITEIKELSRQGEALDFSLVTDITELLDLSEKGGVVPLQGLTRVRDFIITSQRIGAFLGRFKNQLPSLADERKDIAPLKDLGEQLVPAVTESGELNPARFPELRRIREDMHSLRQEMEKRLHSLIYSPAMEKVLQEKLFTTRNERYVVLVRASMKHGLQGNTLDISSSGATLFVEPYEIIPLNNRIASLAADLQIETGRILKELSAAVGANAGELRSNLAFVGTLDFLNAAARLSLEIRGTEPAVTGEPLINLHGARHPLLSLMQPGKVVPNDIFMGEDFHCLIISGANTGGKTVLLKTIGLCALLVMHGLHVPAGPDSVMGVFTAVMADIGDDQSIARSLSSFSGQVIILKEMMERADGRALLLIDEIVVGTNPRQGAALAQAVLEEMIKTGARIVVTTHYPELKQLASQDGRFQNASVSFDMETLAPTFRVMTGSPGVSFTLEIARTCGIPEPILSRARGLLDEREISYEALLERTQRHAQEAEEERARLAELKAEAAREKERYLAALREQERITEEIKREKGIGFLEEIKEYRRRAAERIRELQTAGMKAAGGIREELKSMEDTVARRLREDSARRLAHRYVPFDPASAGPGNTAFIISLEKEGTIQSVDVHDGSAEIMLGSSIKARFKFNDILLRLTDEVSPPPPAGRRARRHETGQAASSGMPLTVQTRYNTIDLRGMRVDEALDRVERDLDRMIRSGINAAVVIHGHGTGALKEAVRNSLKHSPYVRGYRPGETGEGGDGVSIVYLKE